MPRRHLKIVLFSIIGVFNTLLDVALYVAVLDGAHSILIANIVSTSTALVGSYLLNSRLTFKSRNWTIGSFIGFIVVTLFGLWVLQTALIYGFNEILGQVVSDHTWRMLGNFEHVTRSVAPKLLATAFTFVWNFAWYNKVIFKDEHKSLQPTTIKQVHNTIQKAAPYRGGFRSILKLRSLLLWLFLGFPFVLTFCHNIFLCYAYDYPVYAYRREL